MMVSNELLDRVDVFPPSAPGTMKVGVEEGFGSIWTVVVDAADIQGFNENKGSKDLLNSLEKQSLQQKLLVTQDKNFLLNVACSI